MPYCLQKQPDGRYVVLNREYKPLGFKTREQSEYEKYPLCLQRKGIGQKTAARLSYKGSDDVNRIFLYNDGCVPMDMQDAAFGVHLGPQQPAGLGHA